MHFLNVRWFSNAHDQTIQVLTWADLQTHKAFRMPASEAGVLASDLHPNQNVWIKYDCLQAHEGSNHCAGLALLKALSYARAVQPVWNGGSGHTE